ncbi:uncharacterized protein LOC144701945 [Wolffia australiana]
MGDQVQTGETALSARTTGDRGPTDENHRPLKRCTVLSYGVGHMLNDITAACWFTYLLLFLTDIGLSPRNASIVMLSGQVADGFMTVLSGELIDRFGRFKLWHFGGSVLVAVSFSSVFGGCLLCQILGVDSDTFEMIGYGIFAAIFNVGWAATQVSHMAMVNYMTLNESCRVALASCRNAFTMVANLSLFAIALAVFSIYDSKSAASIQNQYRWIAYISIFIGSFFVVVFFLGTKEPRLKQQHHKDHVRVSWAYWFNTLLYYQVASVYMFTRLVTNVSQALFAFYVINDLDMVQSSKALVPGIIYVSSFVVSIILQEMKWNGCRLKFFYSCGALLWVVSGVGIFFLPCSAHDLMYLLSISIGVANALMTVTGTSMVSVLVSNNLNGCAFVYGSLSFLDKISCGVALFIIESYQKSPGSDGPHHFSSCLSVTRYGTGLLPATFSLLGAAVAYSMNLEDVKPRTLAEPLLV